MEKDNQQKDQSIDKDIEQLEQSSTQQKKQQTQEKQSLMPKKFSHKKIRAHANPLDDTYYPFPQNPDFVNWSIHYPSHFKTEKQIDPLAIYVNTPQYPIHYKEKQDPSLNGTQKSIDFLDVGCGFGGLLFALAENFQGKLSLGIEIRQRLVDYIGEKIRALRNEQDKCHNISVLRTNAMRHFLQYFRKGSIEKIFFGFPDPHFKAKNYRRRIVNTGFLSEYAYVLKKGGKLYCITDVKDLHEWHVEKITTHTQFRVIPEEELKDDLAYKLIFESSEECQKVTRRQQAKYAIVAERI